MHGIVYTTIAMDGFKNIEIRNFRGIDHLKIGLEGIDKLLTVNMQGDGLRRYLNIVAASAASDYACKEDKDIRLS